MPASDARALKRGESFSADAALKRRSSTSLREAVALYFQHRGLGTDLALPQRCGGYLVITAGVWGSSCHVRRSSYYPSSYYPSSYYPSSYYPSSYYPSSYYRRGVELAWKSRASARRHAFHSYGLQPLRATRRNAGHLQNG